MRLALLQVPVQFRWIKNAQDKVKGRMIISQWECKKRLLPMK
jgi:hypothetical protein